MPTGDTIDFYRMRLPHWEVKRGVYFVTMHVKGSIPMRVLKELEQCAIESERLRGDAKREKHRYMFKIMEEALHADRKIDYLARPEIAAVCMEAIHARERDSVWESSEYVLMPNHIHIFFQLTSGTLKRAMESFKRWTSLHTKPLLKLKRSLWQRDWFDHWSRSPAEDEHIQDYIRNNPIKAGLVKDHRNWPYASWNDPELLSTKKSKQP